MQETAFALRGSHELIQELADSAGMDDVRVSEPMATESAADALDSPVGGEEIKQFLELLTVILKSATALTAFVTALRTALKKRPKEVLVVVDPRTGRVKGQLTGEASEAQIKKILSK